MRVNDTADERSTINSEFTIKNCMGRGIGGRIQCSFDNLSFKIDNHHVFRLEVEIRHPRRLYREHSLLRIEGRHITPRVLRKTADRYLPVCGPGFLFKRGIFGHYFLQAAAFHRSSFRKEATLVFWSITTHSIPTISAQSRTMSVVTIFEYAV